MNEATRELHKKQAALARRQALEAQLVRSRVPDTSVWTVKLTQDDSDALMDKDVAGSGGRQSLLRAFQASIRRNRVEGQPDRLTLSQADLARAVSYWNGTGEASDPGKGGDQALIPMQSFLEAGLIHPRPNGANYREKGNLALFE